MKGLKMILAVLAVGLSVSCGKKEAPPVGGTPPSSTAVSEPAPTDTSGGAYANDAGQQFIIPESQAEKYSQNARRGYSLLKFKCSQCHTTARPLNAQYLDVDSAAVDRLKKSRPELFANRYLLQIEEGVWKRKIKQMAGKSGAKISNEDAQLIYAFLLEHYQDKIGKNAEKADQWIAHRKKLLEQFKKEYPERYKLLYGGQ